MALTARTDMQAFIFAVRGKLEHPIDGFVAATEKASHYLLHGMRKHSSNIIKEFESFVLSDVQGICLIFGLKKVAEVVTGLVLNHNGRLAELKAKIRLEIREGLGMLSRCQPLTHANCNAVTITNDPKIQMQYDRYEKLIVVERGVELIYWLKDIPFVTCSNIGSIHTLDHLLAALHDNDNDKRCHWVRLSEETWEARKATWYAGMAKAIPSKRKQKTIPVESDSASDSDGTGNDDSEEAKRQRLDDIQNNAPSSTHADAPESQSKETGARRMTIKVKPKKTTSTGKEGTKRIKAMSMNTSTKSKMRAKAKKPAVSGREANKENVLEPHGDAGVTMAEGIL